MRSKVAAIVKRYNVDDARAEAIADEIMTLDASDELKDKVERWKQLDILFQVADDHTKCPECGEQFIACGCYAVLADQILCDLFDIER